MGFVNPLTVLGFIHTTKQEGHKAIVQRRLAGSRESNRGHNRVRRDGRWNSRDGHSDSFRHLSASAVPGSGSPRVRTSDGPHRVQVRWPRQKKQRVPAVCWRGQLVLGWLADALPFRQVWGGAPRCVHQKGSGWLEDDLLDVLWHQLVSGGSCQVARGVLGHSAVPNGQEVRCLAQWSTVDTWQLCCAKFDVQARPCCPPTF